MANVSLRKVTLKKATLISTPSISETSFAELANVSEKLASIASNYRASGVATHQITSNSTRVNALADAEREIIAVVEKPERKAVRIAFCASIGIPESVPDMGTCVKMQDCEAAAKAYGNGLITLRGWRVIAIHFAKNKELTKEDLAQAIAWAEKWKHEKAATIGSFEDLVKAYADPALAVGKDAPEEGNNSDKVLAAYEALSKRIAADIAKLKAMDEKAEQAGAKVLVHYAAPKLIRIIDSEDEVEQKPAPKAPKAPRK